jgi:hypothetical protein
MGATWRIAPSFFLEKIMLSKEDFENLTYETNSFEELINAIGMDLMRMNNNIYPKLHSMPMVANEDMDMLVQIFNRLSDIQKDVIEIIRERY